MVGLVQHGWEVRGSCFRAVFFFVIFKIWVEGTESQQLKLTHIHTHSNLKARRKHENTCPHTHIYIHVYAHTHTNITCGTFKNTYP